MCFTASSSSFIPSKAISKCPLIIFIIAWLASLGIDVFKDTINPLYEKYVQIQLHNFSLAKMTKEFMTMVWVDGHDVGADDDDDNDKEAPQLRLGQPIGILDCLEQVEKMLAKELAQFIDFQELIDTCLEELSLEHHAFDQCQFSSQF